MTTKARTAEKETSANVPPGERSNRRTGRASTQPTSHEPDNDTTGDNAPRRGGSTAGRHAQWVRTPETRSPQAQAAYDAAAAAWDFGQAVHDRRTELGWSQAELARVAGMQSQAISRLELGGTTPTLPLIKRIARALGVTVEITLDTPDENDPDGTITITLTPHSA